MLAVSPFMDLESCSAPPSRSSPPRGADGFQQYGSWHSALALPRFVLAVAQRVVEMLEKMAPARDV